MGENEEVLPSRFEKLLGKYDSDKSPIVIYPDCVQGNPLGAKKVARYLMAKQYLLNGHSIEYVTGEFLFCYSHAVNASLPQYNIIVDECCTKFDVTRYPKKNKVCIYYGKIRLSENFEEVAQLVNRFDEVYLITRAHPKNKEDLYRNIAESKLLIMLDSLSHTAYEATLLGTPVYFADKAFEKEYKGYNYRLYGFHYEDNPDELLEGYDYDKLLSNSREILTQEQKNNETKTLEIMREIESYFATSRLSIKREMDDKFKLALAQDLTFFEVDWKLSPIYNCTNSNSVISYHLIKNYADLYIFLRLILGFIRALKVKPRDIQNSLKMAVINYIGRPFLDLYLYKKNIKKYKKKFTFLNTQRLNGLILHNTVAVGPIDPEMEKEIMSTRLIKLLWKWLG